MQTIKPSWGSKLFALAKFDKIIFDAHKIVVNYKGYNTTIDINSILNYKIKKSFLSNQFIINLKSGESHKIDGFPDSAIEEFINEFDKYFAETYYMYHYGKAYNLCQTMPTNNTYWRKQLFRDLCQKASEEFNEYKELKVAPSLQQKTKLDMAMSLFLQEEDIRKIHNSKFIKNEKTEFSYLFDNVESNPLTDKQKDAVITYEKNSLILAGAGSGKTSVMVAKAGYLIQRYGINPSNILLLAFNKKASIELKERIKSKLNIEMDSLTFHALGLSIIAQVDDAKPTLGSWAEDDKKMGLLIQKLIDNILSKDEKFTELFIEYFQGLYSKYRSEFDFETYGDYIDYIKSIELRSFNGDLVKSYEECEIANFLFLNQIAYQYEKRYEYSTESKEYRQYQPDFYLTDYGIYIEHFGVDKDGNTAPYVPTQKYHEGMVWKRALHRHHKTKLVETYSCEKQKGILTSNLKDKLALHDVEINPISTKEAILFLKQSGMINDFAKLCATFLSNFKSNNHDINELRAKVNTLKDSKRLEVFLELFERIFDEYEKYQKAEQMIDFNDMINKAVSYIRSGKYESKYTHILVDEFQDISTSRAEMVKLLISQKQDSALCVVGDDWQSINRFAGSDISIIRNFSSMFGDSETINLDYTFRYNNEISKVSQTFIESNPNQLSKKIKTIKQIKDKALFIWWDSIDIVDSINTMLETISKKRPNEKLSVFILARFWHIIPDDINSLNVLYPNITITSLTVHASKGLEADYVVILGNEAGKFGFPSAIEDDPIINLVLAESEEFDFAEERRLFYVAMTRAKDEVHFFASLTKRSLFIEELLEDNKSNIVEIGTNSEEQEPCIKCTTGKLVKRKTQKTGKLFLACINYPYCDYMRSITYCKKCGHGCMIKIESDKLYKCSDALCDGTSLMCQDCGGVMIKRKGKFGEFLGCLNYPICRNIQKINNREY